MASKRTGGQRRWIKDHERLVVRVDLMGAKPPIWRRLHLQPDLPLDWVHEAIQAAFGWTNSHLHEFEVGKRGLPAGVQRFGMSLDSEFGSGMWDDDDSMPEESVTVGQFLKEKGDVIRYTYDFGDNWEHSIKLEKVITVEKDSHPVACVDGRRMSPSEDCGGIWGWEWLIEVSKDPDHPDYDDAVERVEWTFGEAEFDPAAFNLAAVQSRIERTFGQRGR